MRSRLRLPRSVTRRDFLNGVLVGASGLALGPGLAGCGGDTPPQGDGGFALPPSKDKGDVFAICHAVRDGKTWSLPAPSGDLLDCVVIGAGVSGLVAARKLMRLGADKVLVLEKDAAAGGLARMDGSPPLVYSQAVAYSVFPYNDNLVETYEDLGVVTGKDADGAPVIPDKYILKAPGNSSYVAGKWVADSWETGLEALPYPSKVLADLKAFREQMKTFYDYVGKDGLVGFDTPTDASTADPEIRALDGMSLLEWVTSQGWDPAVSKFWDPYARSSLGTTHDRLSAWAAINFLGAEFFPELSQPGGNAYLTKSLAEKLGAERVKTGAFVLEVKNEGDEVHVTYLEAGDKITKVRAKAAIYAGPAFVAKRVIPEMIPAGRTEASSFKYTPYLVANLHVDRTPEGLGYDNWIHDESSYFTDVIIADWAGLAAPAHASPKRKNVLTVYAPRLNDGARSELLTGKMGEFETGILAWLEKVLPGTLETVTAFDLYRWGHAMLAPEKGSVFGAARVNSQKPLGRISFAGHDVDGLAAFENAVGAAYRAAAEVAAVIGL